MRCLLVGLMCLSLASVAHAACDEASLVDAEVALDSVNRAFQDEIAADLLAQKCSAELPPTLRALLQQFVRAKPEARRAVVLDAMQQEHALWTRACLDGDAIAADAQRKHWTPEAQRRELFRRCKLSEIGTAEELVGARAQLELALIVRQWMLDRDMDKARVRRWTRTLAGIAMSAPPPPPTSQPTPGILSKKQIRSVIERHLNEVRDCYEKAMQTRGDLAGTVNVQFTIGGAGAVVASSIVSSTMQSPELDECLVLAVRRWQFPKPIGGGLVVVNYPFVLKTAK